MCWWAPYGMAVCMHCELSDTMAQQLMDIKGMIPYKAVSLSANSKQVRQLRLLQHACLDACEVLLQKQTCPEDTSDKTKLPHFPLLSFVKFRPLAQKNSGEEGLAGRSSLDNGCDTTLDCPRRH